MNRLLIGLTLCFVCISPLQAHEFEWTDVRFEIKDQSFEVHIIFDLDAVALGKPPGSDSRAHAEELMALSREEFQAKKDGLSNWIQRRIRVRFDDQPVNFEVSYPRDLQPETEEPSVLGTLARLEGKIPEDAKKFSFFSSRALPAVRLDVVGPDGPMGEPIPIPDGQRSENINLSELEPAGTWTVAKRYLALGFFHIIPVGPDHILFVLGLFLFCRELKPLVLQVTAFTVAHTITLALAIQGIVSLPSAPVEILIAASIVYVAVENIVSETFRPHRVAVVFGFGLLHGLGFAGVLGELGLPQTSFTAALIAFNIGVEVGQLAVIALAFLAVGWWRNSEHYQTRVVRPVSIVIGIVALYWVVERIIGAL